MSVRVVVGLLVSRRRVGALGDSTVGLVSRVPSRMCWMGCCVAASRFSDAPVPEAHRGQGFRRRRGAVLLASRTQRAFVAYVGERRRSAAGARHDFSRAVRRVERRDVVDALCGRGVVMRRAGARGAIASRPARRFADDDRSDLVVVTCFCLVSECVSGVSECVSGGGPGDACPRRGWAQTSAGGRVSAVSEPCGGVGTSANPTHLGVWRLFLSSYLRRRKKGIMDVDAGT